MATKHERIPMVQRVDAWPRPPAKKIPEWFMSNGERPTKAQRDAFNNWLLEQCSGEEQAAARKKNGWWRNFWTEYGGDLVFVASVIGGCVAVVLIYLGLENLGWFRL